MISKNNIPLIVLLVAFLVTVFFINDQIAFGGLSSKQCDTECQPPTLGLNLESRRYVSDGFGINGQFFDVEYFSQKIPTQNFTVGELVDNYYGRT
jgi:hypothetical protein